MYRRARRVGAAGAVGVRASPREGTRKTGEGAASTLACTASWRAAAGWM